MMTHPLQSRILACLAMLALAATGCQLMPSDHLGLQENDLLSEQLIERTGFASGGAGALQDDSTKPGVELNMLSLPRYRIEPPDVLLIDAIRMAPKPPYFIQTLDTLQVIVLGTLPEQPIAGQFQVEPSGMINLGPAYGAIDVTGLSVAEATDKVRTHLERVLQNPEVSLSLVQQAGQQQIAGEHMIGPDGTINLGIYGSVYVTGMTLDEARAAIEEHLSQHLDSPQVSVDVFAYNSKVYYVLTEGAGLGDSLVRVPITGKETVLDAIAQIGGLQRVSSKTIWISRPAPSGVGCDQILPVDWNAITKGGSTATNYQLLPGDRVFVAEDRMIATDTFIGKIISPVERIFGFMLLGGQTIQTFQRFPRGFSSSGR